VARIGIVVPTADPHREPAASALVTLGATTKGHETSITPVVSSGADFIFAKSVNRGIEKHKDVDHVVIVNDDCFMDPGWLDAMLETCKRHPNVGIVGALLRYPDGRVQHAGGIIEFSRTAFAWRMARNGAPFYGVRTALRMPRQAAVPNHHYRLRKDNRIDFVTGACMLMTRDCLDRVGTFDEGYRMGGEDIDYCVRALRIGFEVALARKSTGIHLHGASSHGLEGLRKAGVRRLIEQHGATGLRKATRNRRGLIHPDDCDR
jgi:O-antigen biosynthesis protein